MSKAPTIDKAYRAIVKHFRAAGTTLSQDRSRLDHWGNPKCFYRSPDGQKCAVGVLIPDGEYRKTFENSPATYVATQLGWGGMHTPLTQFLNRAQGAHDSSKSKAEFLRRLKRIRDEARWES